MTCERQHPLCVKNYEGFVDVVLSGDASAQEVDRAATALQPVLTQGAVLESFASQYSASGILHCGICTSCVEVSHISS